MGSDVSENLLDLWNDGVAELNSKEIVVKYPLSAPVGVSVLAEVY